MTEEILLIAHCLACIRPGGAGLEASSTVIGSDELLIMLFQRKAPDFHTRWATIILLSLCGRAVWLQAKDSRRYLTNYYRDLSIGTAWHETKLILDLNIEKWRAESPGCIELIGVSFLMHVAGCLLNVSIIALPKAGQRLGVANSLHIVFSVERHHTDVHASGI